MNKTELVAVVSEKVGLTKKQAEEALDTIVAQTTKALKKGDTVKLAGFGTFTRKTRKARKGISPATGKEIKIPASKTVGFKAAKALKEAVK